MTATLELRSVSKWYGQVAALSEVSMTVGPGVTGLVGQNGAGKSTLIKLAVGLLRPSQGEVLLHGHPPLRARARADLGYCPDIDRFYERLSGLEFTTWMLRLQGFDRRAARRRAAEVLARLGLESVMRRRISGYSKGMRQRIKLAQALAHEPRTVLLDEPLTGLDPIGRHEVGTAIAELGARGVTVLVSSHVLHELEHVAERFVLLHHGRLTAEGGLRELRRQLASRPRRVLLRSRRPRDLAARLCEMPDVCAVRLAERGAVVAETQGDDEVWRRFTELGAAEEGLIEELAPLDENLEAVFDYLVA